MGNTNTLKLHTNVYDTKFNAECYVQYFYNSMLNLITWLFIFIHFLIKANTEIAEHQYLVSSL
jgi:hypothetical protein